MSDFMITRRGKSSVVERPELTVTAPGGSTVICTQGTKTITAQESSGTWLFKLPEYGSWTISAAKNGQTASATVDVQQDYTATVSYAKIYGISRDITLSSPTWVRTDDAVGKTATASVGTVAGASDFNTCYPWNGIERETLYTNDVMVKIPKFWFRRYLDGNIEHIQISDRAYIGFSIHPAFNHGGIEKDYLYLGAYKTSNNYRSVSGGTPLVDQTRAATRANIAAKGSGWGLIDIAAVSAVQMLILVEFATNNVQAVIGKGYCDGNTAGIDAGSCNNVPNLTGRPSGTDGMTDIVWRGIEGVWGNVWEWVDGVNWNNGTYYVCNDPSQYADNTATNYSALSFTGATNWSASYITVEGLDAGNDPHVMLPSAAGSGSSSTYQCDTCWTGTGWRTFRSGGSWSTSSGGGIFTFSTDQDSTFTRINIGSRLLYIPQ